MKKRTTPLIILLLLLLLIGGTYYARTQHFWGLCHQQTTGTEIQTKTTNDLKSKAEATKLLAEKKLTVSSAISSMENADTEEAINKAFDEAIAKLTNEDNEMKKELVDAKTKALKQLADTKEKARIAEETAKQREEEARRQREEAQKPAVVSKPKPTPRPTPKPKPTYKPKPKPTPRPTPKPAPKKADYCPNGDYTGNRYDGKCGSKPKPQGYTCRYKGSTFTTGNKAQCDGYIANEKRMEAKRAAAAAKRKRERCEAGKRASIAKYTKKLQNATSENLKKTYQRLLNKAKARVCK